MHPIAVVQVLALVTLANSVPVVAKKILGDRFGWPLDFGVELPDRHRLLGHSKTIRGVVLGVLFSWAGAPLIGLEPGLGAQVGALAMAGDLLSHFARSIHARIAASGGFTEVTGPQIPLPFAVPLALSPLDCSGRNCSCCAGRSSSTQ